MRAPPGQTASGVVAPYPCKSRGYLMKPFLLSFRLADFLPENAHAISLEKFESLEG